MKKAVIFDMFETLITHYNCPLYFSEAMSADAGIDTDAFLKTWRPTEPIRSIGQMTFEEVIEKILRENHAYSDEVLQKIVRKRTETKCECFRHLDPGILPLLDGLKSRGIRIGLISNCFSEEAPVIRESILAPYFDSMCLSWELGIEKPDPAIFFKCVSELKLRPEDCLYVGDGGASELEAATSLGMTAVRACWYIKDNPLYMGRIDGRFPEEYEAERILSYL